MKMLFGGRVRGRIVAGIDIGSAKICCWIAEINEGGSHNILGTSYVSSEGMSSGKITDISALEENLSSAIDEAEKEAGISVRDVFVSVKTPCFGTSRMTAEINLSDTPISDYDVERLMRNDCLKREGYEAIHVVPLSFCVDRKTQVENPRGMSGKVLSGDFFVMHAPHTFLKGIFTCFFRCQVGVRRIMCSGYSAALACLVPDEQELGSSVIDIGADGTSITSFAEGKCVSSHLIPLGSRHITRDVARGLDTPLAHAERLKILYGSALPLPNDYKELVPVIPLGDLESGEISQIARSFLINVIQARTEEILISVKRKLIEISSQNRFAIQRIVITGGGSLLPGIRELAQRILGAQIRMGHPVLVDDVRLKRGDLSSVSGLFVYASQMPKFLSSRGGLCYLVNTFSTFSSWLRKKL